MRGCYFVTNKIMLSITSFVITLYVSSTSSSSSSSGGGGGGGSSSSSSSSSTAILYSFLHFLLFFIRLVLLSPLDLLLETGNGSSACKILPLRRT
jgi:hypothetical protein